MARKAGPAALLETLQKKLKQQQNAPPSATWLDAIINNHADAALMICLAMFLMLFWPVTADMAKPFLSLSYNSTIQTLSASGSGLDETVIYKNGFEDIKFLFFMFLVWLTAHAIFLEFIVTPLASYFKRSRFEDVHNIHNDGFGAVMSFSFWFWANRIISSHRYFSEPAQITNNFPATQFDYDIKCFYLFLISFWIHLVFEPFLKRVGSFSDMAKQSLHALLNVAIVSYAYYFNYTHVAICLVGAQYLYDFLIQLGKFVQNFSASSSLSTPIHQFSVLVFLAAKSVITFLSYRVFLKTDAEGNYVGGEPALFFFGVIMLAQVYSLIQFVKDPNGLGAFFGKKASRKVKKDVSASVSNYQAPDTARPTSETGKKALPRKK